MRYEAKLSLPELDAIEGLIGKPLDRVSADGWGAELRCGNLSLLVVPHEVATTDADHPTGDVERPKVLVDGGPEPGSQGTVLGEQLGLIRAANIISVLVGFTPMVDCPALEILPGVILPAGPGWAKSGNYVRRPIGHGRSRTPGSSAPW
jgi:hypothetical protein